jgi:hypothetical protein
MQDFRLGSSAVVVFVLQRYGSALIGDYCAFIKPHCCSKMSGTIIQLHNAIPREEERSPGQTTKFQSKEVLDAHNS